MSYVEFFGFKENPFRITPDISYFYSAPSHAEALQTLNYFCASDEGFMVIVGEPGTGKTITLRKFLNEIPDNIEYAYILFPSLEPEDMFRAVLEDFGFTIDPGISKNTLFARFRDFLTDKKKQGKKLLLVIDEAQNLPVRTLEELRILSNLETEKEKLIQFILAGQPELEKKLNSTELRQMKQRVTLHVPLRNMDFEEMSKYVAFRLSEAGFQGQYPDTAFYTLLFSVTSGIPRMVNLMMERTLMAAYVDQSKILTQTHLHSAAVSLRLKAEKKSGKVIAWTAAAVIVIACLAGGGYYYEAVYQPEIQARHEQAVNAALEQEKARLEAQKAEAAKKAADKKAADAAKAKAEQAAAAQTADQTNTPTAATQPNQNNQANASTKAGADTKTNNDTQTQEQPKIVSGQKGMINVPILNIRKTPDTTGDIVAKAHAGQTVTVKGGTGDWYQVSFFDKNGVDSGWVFRKYITLK